MNENIDLTKILKDCPKGTKLYSTVLGCVSLEEINDYNIYPIVVSCKNGNIENFTADGKMIVYYGGECTLFPSKEQRDWSKFTAPWYKKDNLVNPKFKVGDWIISSVLGIAHIIGVNDSNAYQLEYIDGKQKFSSIDYVNYEYDKWTINDAKDGDVLCCKSGWMCIFKAINNQTNTFSSYCSMSSDKYFLSSGSESHTLDKNVIKAYNGEIYPATKEQRNLLFQKIKEAGYKWNNETKTLEKLIKPKFKVGDRIRHKETNRDDVYEISKVYNDSYGIDDTPWMIYMKYQDQYELVPNKFDPKTLKPFDKVLVRGFKSSKWRCDHFSYFKDDDAYPYTASISYVFCVPYNDDTKHLVGTTDEAPEYYRYWED